MKFWSVMAAVSVLALAGCGASGAGSCQETTSGIGFCVDFVGADYTSTSAQSACTQQGGTYASGGCAAGSNGTCDIQKGTPAEFTETFSSGGTMADFQSACQSAGGTYTP